MVNRVAVNRVVVDQLRIGELVDDVGERLLAADVAGEDDERDAARGAVGRLPERDDPGQHRAADHRAGDRQPAGGDVGRRDPALGDDEPRRSGGEHGLHHLDDGGRHAAGDVERRRAVRPRDQGATGADHDVAAGQALDAGVDDAGEVLVAAGVIEHVGDVDLDLGQSAT